MSLPDATPYEALLNALGGDELVIFVDAVHPTHIARPVGCWAPKGSKLALSQTTGRDRLNLHSAIDLETGKTIIREELKVDALSAISLLEGIEARYQDKRCVHVFLDNAKCHHALMVREWMKSRKTGLCTETKSRTTFASCPKRNFGSLRKHGRTRLLLMKKPLANVPRIQNIGRSNT